MDKHPSRPQVPNSIQTPAGEEIILQVRAAGFQVYVCQASDDQKLSWALKGPEATLSDVNGMPVGSHFAGPTWKHADGSQVVGKVAARADALEPDSIPWCC